MKKLAALVLMLFALGAESWAQSGPLPEGSANVGRDRQTLKEDDARAIVLVIDKSGSMREENRIRYAQEAAKAVAQKLKDNDFLGIVGFDINAFVLVPLEPVGKLRRVIDGQIDRLKPGGQTFFYPALLEAKRQMDRATTGRKHILLLSDGETRGSQSDLVDLVGVMKNECKITTSTVGIGKDADVRIMKIIAQYGGGAFQHSSDPSTLPQIVLEDVLNERTSVLGNGETEKCQELTLAGRNTQPNVGLDPCAQVTESRQLSNENLAMIFNRCGTAYRTKRDYERAIEYFNRSIQLSPNIAEIFLNRGNVYRDKKDYDRAIQDYDEAIRQNPNYFLALNDRAIAYRAKQDYSRAIKDYDRLIRLNPSYSASFNNRGNVYRDMRDYDRAIRDYDEAIRLNPNYALALNNRAAAHRNKKNYERALADYEAAARIDPKVAQHKSMGYTLFYLGWMAESAEAMERAVTAAPQDMYAILWHYIALARENRMEIASRKLGEHAAKLNETRWPAPVVHFFLGKINEKEMYTAAENPDPKKRSEQICEANFYAAEAKLLKGVTNEAIPLLRAAEKECPSTFYEAHGASAELRRVGAKVP